MTSPDTPAPDIAIVVADDARFSAAIVGKALNSAGYGDVRFATSGAECLQLLEERAADVVLADWMMPEMDGIELLRRIRERDAGTGGYTWVTLLSGKEEGEGSAEALANGADDFVSKGDLRETLVPRLLPAVRIIRHMQALAERAAAAPAADGDSEHQVIDPVTGLGNLRFARQITGDTLRHVDSRGGAACILALTIGNIGDIRSEHSQEVVDELLAGFARRLRQLVRPLDMVTRPGADDFAVITHQPDIDNCNAGSFRRIYDGLNQRSFRTSAGFIPVSVAMTVCSGDNRHGLPGADELLELTRRKMEEAKDTGLVTVGVWEGY